MKITSKNQKLIISVKKNHINTVNQLLYKGANVNVVFYRDRNILTSLHLAVENNSPGMVKLLVERGADTSFTHYYSSFNILEYSIDKNISIKQLVRGDKSRKQYLDSLKIIELLIHSCLNIDYKTKNTSLIFKAVEAGIEVTKLFIEAGFKLNIYNKNQCNLLYKPMINNEFDIIRLLLKNCEHINRIFSRTDHVLAVHVAVNFNNLNLVRLLVEEFNVDINTEHTISYNTALNIPIIGKKFRIAEYLLDKGGIIYLNNCQVESQFTAKIISERQKELLLKAIGNKEYMNCYRKSKHYRSFILASNDIYQDFQKATDLPPEITEGILSYLPSITSKQEFKNFSSKFADKIIVARSKVNNQITRAA